MRLIKAGLEFSFRCAIAVALTSLATTTFAAPNGAAFLCEVKTRGHGGWTPKQIGFRFVENDSQVKVLDAFIQKTKNGPLTTTVSVKVNGDHQFRWVLNLPTTDGTVVSASYNVEFSLASQTGKVTTHIPQFTGGRNGGDMTCAPYSGPAL